MNYYPFHIGDYASATRHLSWDEDCAYRRLLDVYYTSEKPLPLDIKRVCRLAVASSKVQRDAVAAVLEEFFEKTDAGWTNARADEEIDAMRIKQAAGEEKAAHEAGRMSRYRERRAAMFQALRAVDVVPAWDISMKELQHLHGQRCNATGGDPATRLQREQAVSGDATATAVPTPTPTPTPTPKSNVVSPLASPADRGSRLNAEWKIPAEWLTWCREQRPDLNPALIADQFRDFWIAKPGKDGRKTDWFATWRNWCRAQKQDQPGRRNGGGPDWTGSAV